MFLIHCGVLSWRAGGLGDRSRGFCKGKNMFSAGVCHGEHRTTGCAGMGEVGSMGPVGGREEIAGNLGGLKIVGQGRRPKTTTKEYYPGHKKKARSAKEETT